MGKAGLLLAVLCLGHLVLAEGVNETTTPVITTENTTTTTTTITTAAELTGNVTEAKPVEGKLLAPWAGEAALHPGMLDETRYRIECIRVEGTPLFRVVSTPSVKTFAVGNQLHIVLNGTMCKGTATDTLCKSYPILDTRVEVTSVTSVAHVEGTRVIGMAKDSRAGAGEPRLFHMIMFGESPHWSDFRAMIPTPGGTVVIEQAYGGMVRVTGDLPTEKHIERRPL